jgi:hypothetical protein
MRRIVALIGAVALVSSFGLSALAQEKSVSGEVIEIACHAKDAKRVGEAHKNCATSCAKKGAAMGILASDGVYAITGDYTANNNAKLLEFIGSAVDAKGDVTEKDGKKMIAVKAMAVKKAS